MHILTPVRGCYDVVTWHLAASFCAVIIARAGRSPHQPLCNRFFKMLDLDAVNIQHEVAT